MEPNRAGSGVGRVIAGAALGAALVGGAVAAFVIFGGTDDGTVATAPVATSATTMSAEAGLAARAQRAQFGPAGIAGVETAGAKLAADAAIPLDCGPGDGADYTPTPEELATANADTDAQARVFDTYTIPYTRSTDDFGFVGLAWDSTDVVAQSVNDSFWADRYPTLPPAQEDLDRIRQENAVVAHHLDAAGISYTRSTSTEGWETIVYNYDDPKAQAAVSDAYAELYPAQPPTAAESVSIKADNDKLAAGFDAAGVTYHRASDELGWEWIEWDYEDPATQTKVDSVFAQLYPPAGGPDCLAATEGGASPPPAVAAGADAVTPAKPPTEATPTGTGAGSSTASEPESDPALGQTPEQVARRETEVSALTKGFTAAGVTNQVIGESPWQSVNFDIKNQASVPVVAKVLASRP
jgi:hypothetical protein